MSEANQSIRVVARRTGLSGHVIRIWEKRYGAVNPARTGTNRRLYSELDLERLLLLAQLTTLGHSIGHIAKLPMDTLRGLLAASSGVLEGRGGSGKKVNGRTGGKPGSVGLSSEGTEEIIERAIQHVRALDAKGLEDALEQAEAVLGNQGALQRMIAPLAQRIGELWREGAITAAHEHFASAVMRTMLGQAAKGFSHSDHAPVLVVGTPTGQLHELGALLAGATASNLGWRVTYLGAALPAAEIACAASQNAARAVALSIVYPEDDPRIEGELIRLRQLLPRTTQLLVGGRAMSAYRSILDQIGARAVEDLVHLSRVLDELRHVELNPMSHGHSQA